MALVFVRMDGIVRFLAGSGALRAIEATCGGGPGVLSLAAAICRATPTWGARPFRPGTAKNS